MFNDRDFPQIGVNYFGAPFDATQNTVVLLSIAWSVLTTILWIWTPLLFLLAGVFSLLLITLVAAPALLIKARIERVSLLRVRNAQLEQLRREETESKVL